uniref:RING finger protein 166-like n=1 Tax=Cyanistes caeruleus TaxID=156563 RepID=A0A8C0UBL8_CYACU
MDADPWLWGCWESRGAGCPAGLLLSPGCSGLLCAPRFCGECLQPCLQVPSPLCPLCRVPFDPKKVEKASSVEKQLSSYKAPCRGCSKKVKVPVPIVPIVLWNVSRAGEGSGGGSACRKGGSGRISCSAQLPARRGQPDGGQAPLPGNRDRTSGDPCSPKSLSCKEGRVGAAFPLLWVIPCGPEVNPTSAEQSQLYPGIGLLLLFCTSRSVSCPPSPGDPGQNALSRLVLRQGAGADGQLPQVCSSCPHIPAYSQQHSQSLHVCVSVLRGPEPGPAGAGEALHGKPQE